ncbi:MAG TPA: hypothetical protein VLV83_13090 [Acidobacteriota bacterium]|nr:hypothetical protein [Acidobacteriota bacterium]
MRSPWQWIVVITLAAVALTLNIRNELLRQRGVEQMAEASLPRNARVQPMLLVPLAETDSGDSPPPRSERFESHREQLVFVFSPSCRYSRQALGDWARFLNETKQDFRIVALTIGSGEENALLSRVFGETARLAVNPEQIRANRMLTTPQVLWLSRDGRVRSSWVGAQAALPHGQDLENLDLGLDQ